MYQIWVQCEKGEAQKVKHILKTSGHLSKRIKVKNESESGYISVPTELFIEDWEEDSTDMDILLSLGLLDFSLEKTLVVSREESNSKQTDRKGAGIIKALVTMWLEALPSKLLSEIGATVSDLLVKCPKRWSIYQPMVLLPAGSFQSQPWDTLLRRLDSSQQTGLWNGIIQAVGSKEGETSLTHLAVNSGIPLNDRTSLEEQTLNILRSPSGLILLHGEWYQDLHNTAKDNPSEDDFRGAFWVSTKQNGIHQIWAPLYTMFSRGNIKEKTRILSFQNQLTAKTVARRLSGPTLQDSVAVDLYAGIGYFAFSYAKLGMGKVLCWEINSWSVEGLRRGMELNGWSYKIIRGEGLMKPLQEQLDRDTKLIIFEESNEHAAGRIEELRRAGLISDILHVNCGFLPSSEPSWRTAWEILDKKRDGWLHLHENVGVSDVEERRKSIEQEISNWAIEEGSGCVVDLGHVEFVKTFAPGVWHVVFDVHVTSYSAAGRSQTGDSELK